MARYLSIGSDPYVFQVVSDQTNEVIVPVIFDAAPEAALTTAAPAVSVDCYFTELDATSNGVAATLADGVVHGQLKRVQASVVVGGATTLTIASPVSAALDVITFTVVGDAVTLIWSETGGYWQAIEFQNVLGSVVTPTIA